MSDPNNDPSFYLCPKCGVGSVSWRGKKDLQDRKLFICSKDESHIATFNQLMRASGKRSLLD
jgi:hypothetical protein